MLTDFVRGDASELAPQFHMGLCIGSDVEAAAIARVLGFWITGWPCTITSKRAYFRCDDEHIPAPPLERNHSIVNVTERLIATPKEMEEVLRSGTWATIRYAKKMRKPVEIIWPR